MLQDTAARRKAAREIARDAMRGDDGDPLGELNRLEATMIGFAGVHLYIPVADDVACRRALVFLVNQLPELIHQMDHLSERRSKALLAHSTLTKWSQSFKRLVRKNSKQLQALD